MEVEVNVKIGAGFNRRDPTRMTVRNGYRQSRVNTPAGEISLYVPKLRTDTYFPSFFDRHPPLYNRKSALKHPDAFESAVLQVYSGMPEQALNVLSQLVNTIGIEAQQQDLESILSSMKKAMRRDASQAYEERQNYP